MARMVGIGVQDFEEMIKKDHFYVDKTSFIKEWWERKDVVTLITRPRRREATTYLSPRSSENPVSPRPLIVFCTQNARYISHEMII